jgi:hypothetical protein
MDELAVPYQYFPAVLEGIRQGRWRQAKNPKAYLDHPKTGGCQVGLNGSPCQRTGVGSSMAI